MNDIEIQALLAKEHIGCSEFRTIVKTVEYEKCPQKVRLAVYLHAVECTECTSYIETLEELPEFAPTKEAQEKMKEDHAILGRMFNFDEN